MKEENFKKAKSRIGQNNKINSKASSLDILGLSNKEKKVLACLLLDVQTASKNEDSDKSETSNKNINTPLLIHRETHMSRTAIYHILEVLKKRGMVERYKENGKFYYRMISIEEIANKLYEVKIGLNKNGFSPSLKGRVGEGPESMGVIVHQGLLAIQACFTKMFTENKNCKFMGVQGNNTLPLYGEYLGQGFVDELNKKIKENKIIVEGIMSEGWETTSKASFDAEWATHYTGRMANLHQIPKEYFRHQGEIFLFNETLYLITLRELTIIEIRHGDISQSIAMLIKYIMENTHTIDINRRVRELHGI